MNTKLLKQVRDMILKRPRQFDMDDWVVTEIWDNVKKCFVTPSHCGTAACIGGWAIVLDKAPLRPRPVWLRHKREDDDEGRFSVSDTAKDLLELDSRQAVRLFARTHWPAKYNKAYIDAKTFKARAQVAARRINAFIRSKGTK